MNQLIKELADQCYHRYSEHNIDLEKFAQLIIQECCQLLVNHGAEGGRRSEAYYYSAFLLEEHFGVHQ